MSKRIALGRRRAGTTRSNSIAGISKAVATNAGSIGRSAAVVAAASGMVLTLGVPAQANPAAREAAAAPMDALNIERVALQSTVVSAVVAPSVKEKKAVAPVRASVKTAPAPKPKPKPVVVEVPEVAVTNSPALEAETEETSSVQENTSAQSTASAQTATSNTRTATSNTRTSTSNTQSSTSSSSSVAPVTRSSASSTSSATAATSVAPVTRSSASSTSSAAATKSVAPVAPSVNTANLSGIAATASRYSGVPYVWGGSSPSGWDCSGFLQWVYKQHGISISRGTSAILGSGQFVRTSNPKPGDLVFQNGGGHVGIYLGNGMMIGAQNPTVDTMIHSVSRNPLYGYYTLAG
ncbi:cell wall-associated NlpC family hydrolase [Neomicrococcus aestuarii]|uniref:Cell wall-associated NlpC family hydrolase n=1 Tax=Neomicrococcus aestuarii TaxID=556325 RepID=A0A7W8TVI8_9MICC|nr:C40 family peptidase [Neomicrococcus aestuarii]MBB5512311.1 cell wall-associated NlpC family hydrolase [Neomicrococcus aestuarii]